MRWFAYVNDEEDWGITDDKTLVLGEYEGPFEDLEKARLALVLMLGGLAYRWERRARHSATAPVNTLTTSGEGDEE